MKTERMLSNIFEAGMKQLSCVLALSAVLFGLRPPTVSFPLPKPLPRQNRAAQVPVQVRLGGASSDGIISYVVTVSSVTVTDTKGVQTTLSSNPFSVEVMHLAADSEPLLSSTLASGQYREATLTITAAKMTYLSPLTGLLAQKQSNLNLVTRLQFNPVLVVSSTPILLNFQVSVPSISHNSGTRNSAPSPVLALNPKAVNANSRQKPEDGQVQRVVGVVTKVSGSSFSLRNGLSGSLLNFQTNGQTMFINTAFSTLNNLVVVVYGSSRSDGSLLAQSVEAVENGAGIAMEGLVATTIPNSNAMGLVSQDAAGQGMTSGLMGATVSVDTTALPSFAIDTKNVDMTGLESLEFDINTFVPGQHVQIHSSQQLQQDPYGNAGWVAPVAVTLEPQALSGTVANYQPGTTPGTASFDLLLPTDGTAYLSILNPNWMSIHIYQQAATDVQNPSGLSDGAQVEVRGLLFFSALPQSSAHRSFMPNVISPEAERQWVMVAGRILSN